MLKYLLSYIPGKLLPGLINLIGIMIYSRIFSQSDYGEFSYFLAIGTLIQGVFFPWIRMSLSRFIHDYSDEEEKKHLLKGIYNLQYILSLILILLMFIFYLFVSNIYILLMISIIISNSLVELIFANLRSEFLARNFMVSNILRAVSKLTTTVLFSWLIIDGTVSLFLGMLFSNIIVMVFLNKFLTSFSIKSILSNKENIIGFLSYGLPLTITFLMATILNSTDRIFINKFLGSNEVAEYSLAYDFSAFITTNIIMIINMAYYPIIMRSYSTNKNYKERLLEFNKLIFIISSMLLIILITNSYYLSELIFGKNYDTNTMSEIMIIISISTFISGLKAYYFDIVFHIAKNTKLQLIPIVIAALLNIILNIILIPNYGLTGALYATLMSYILASIFSILIGRKLLKIPLMTITSIISILLVVILSFAIDKIFITNDFYKLMSSIAIVIIIFTLYMLIFEMKTIRRIIRGNILD